LDTLSQQTKTNSVHATIKYTKNDVGFYVMNNLQYSGQQSLVDVGLCVNGSVASKLFKITMDTLINVKYNPL